MSIRFISLLIVLLIFLTSCSWLKSRKAVFGGEKAQVENQSKTVPKAQYNELLKKYEALSKMRNKTNRLQPEEKKFLVNEIQNSKNQDLNTVDVFKQKNIPKKNMVLKEVPITLNLSTEEIGFDNLEKDIATVRRAIDLFEANRLNDAMKMLKAMESSPSPQVQVRAKFYIGEILFLQKDFDLAMQIYEGLLKNYAFSGIVLQALGRLIVCSEKLKIPAKKEKYFSMLHDFFG